MEDWLQCAWWDWKVSPLNVTEHCGWTGVVGPNARTALEKLCSMDVGKVALPFMGWADCILAGMPVRGYRNSLSGELCHELAVLAHRARELWEKLMEA